MTPQDERIQKKAALVRRRTRRRTKNIVSRSMPMLPPGFKKDSRVWLHKNPKPRAEDVDKSAILRRFLDSEKSFNANSPCYFMEFQGKQFKKDSRSWLHKSSLKKQQAQRSRRKGPGPVAAVAGDGYREPEFARSNTDVRMSFQQDKQLLLKRKCAPFHASDGDIISNDSGLRQVLRKKRVDGALHGAGGQGIRRVVRTLSEERLNDEVTTIMTYASLNTFGHRHEERMTELADDSVNLASEENMNQQAQPMQPVCGDRHATRGYPVQSHPSLLSCDMWRDAVGIQSDTSSSEHSKASMDTLAPGCQDLYNANSKGEKSMSPDMLNMLAEKLRCCQSNSRSSMESLGEEHAQLKMMSLCASPPCSPCSDGSISGEDLKSSDVDI